MCGIPGVEMKGTLEDWNDLLTKTENLKTMLAPVMDELLLEDWFKSTLNTLTKLIDTFKGKDCIHSTLASTPPWLSYQIRF